MGLDFMRVIDQEIQLRKPLPHMSTSHWARRTTYDVLSLFKVYLICHNIRTLCSLTIVASSYLNLIS